MDRMHAIGLSLGLIIALDSKAFADAPFEAFHVARSSISATVLKKTIGVFTLSSGVKKGKEFRTYRLRGDHWVLDGKIDALATTPVSNYGYHPPMADDLIVNYRYPILERLENHIRVVIEPVGGKSVWVLRQDLEAQFYVNEVYFDQLPTMKEASLDPFFGGSRSTISVFREPSSVSEAQEISSSRNRLFKVLGQRKGFVQLGINHGDEDSPRFEPIGWIPIRDKNGALLVWIASEDNC